MSTIASSESPTPPSRRVSTGFIAAMVIVVVSCTASDPFEATEQPLLPVTTTVVDANDALDGAPSDDASDAQVEDPASTPTPAPLADAEPADPESPATEPPDAPAEEAEEAEEEEEEEEQEEEDDTAEPPPSIADVSDEAEAPGDALVIPAPIDTELPAAPPASDSNGTDEFADDQTFVDECNRDDDLGLARTSCIPATK